jgi:hypothetical protein
MIMHPNDGLPYLSTYKQSYGLHCGCKLSTEVSMYLVVSLFMSAGSGPENDLYLSKALI